MGTSELFVVNLILSVISVPLGILDAITTKKGLSHRGVEEKNPRMARQIEQSPSKWFRKKILQHIAIAFLSILASTMAFLKTPAIVSVLLFLVLLVFDVVYAYVVVHNYVGVRYVKII